MVNTVRVNTDHGRDFNPIANHMINLRNFTKSENHAFSAFRISLHLMLEQALCNLIVSLMVSHKQTTYKRCTNELAYCSGY